MYPAPLSIIMFYTTLCTLAYAGIYLCKKMNLKEWLWAIPQKVALLFLLLVGLCLANSASAQKNLRIAYFGETVTHYGLRSGAEYTLHRNEKSKPGGHVAFNDLYFGITLTAYRHPHNHIGLILAPELGWRHTGRRGGIVQAAISPGLFRSFYEGKTWQTGENDQLDRVRLAGQWGFLPGVSVGFGHRLGRSLRPAKSGDEAPLSGYCNLHYLRQYPYNHSFLNRFALELGVLKKLNTKN